MTVDRRPRKTVLDKAIDNLDAKIAALHEEIKTLELARQHLVDNVKAGRTNDGLKVQLHPPTPPPSEGV